MKWKNNKNYIKAKKDFINSLSPALLGSLHLSLPKIVFLCGGDEKYHGNREQIEKYFIKFLPRHLTFRAEKAWEVIHKSLKSANALELEEWLADFSDVVIILVESFGTVAELGAFSMSDSLRKKLLPILDEKYEKDLSFINTGPVKWTNKDSKYAPVIYTNFSTILTSMSEVQKRINKNYWFDVNKRVTYGTYQYSNKVLLFYYVYLLASLGPINFDEILIITEKMHKIEDKQHIRFIISIGIALNIFTETIIGKDKYYSCIDFEKLFSSEDTYSHYKKIQQYRARNLFSLLKIDEYKGVLIKVNKND